MSPARGRRFGEREAVALFRSAFERRGASVALLGIGDDAAVLERVAAPLVWTIDASVEGTHFERALLTTADIGYRAFQAAASDLGAMGARPLAALSALELPRGFARRELDALTRGQAQAARECGCPIVGGNVARGPVLAVTTTLLGTASRPLRRSGARAGDEVWLVGDVGLAAAGLALLQRRPKRGGRGESLCIAAWRRPRALVAQGARLGGRAHALIDVSDGLAGDAGHLSADSGVRLVIEAAALEEILRPDLVDAARELGREPLELALHGGEDYALLATGLKARRPSFARRIGRVERGRGAWLEGASGRPRRLGTGFDHLEPS